MLDWASEAKREAEEEFRNRITKLWGSIDAFYRMREFSRKRAELLNELYLIYPEIQLQYSDFKESFRSELVGYEWGLCYEAPVVHYRILPNELVFDIDAVDADDKTKAKEVTKHMIVLLKSLGAEPFAGFSGNRGYHVHVLLAPPKGNLEDFVHAAGIKEFRNCIFEWLMSLAKARGIDTSLVDAGIMNAAEHTIRSFYSYNPKGKRWKTPVFGERYGLWKMPKHVYDAVLAMMREGQKRRLLESIVEKIDVEDRMDRKEANEQKQKQKQKQGKISWIEKILAMPNAVSDGRKRLLLHAIIPYLITVRKLSDDEVEAKCKEWLERTRADYSKYKSFVRCEIRAVRRRQILPMREEKFYSMYPDLAVQRNSLTSM